MSTPHLRVDRGLNPFERRSSALIGVLGLGFALLFSISTVMPAVAENDDHERDGDFSTSDDGIGQRILTWGANEDGQLGTQSTANRSVAGPADQIKLGQVRSIAPGGTHVLALDASGTVWSWGSNQLVQLGNGSFAPNTSRAVYRAVGLDDVIQISGGPNHSLALRSDGSVWQWGGNTIDFAASHTPVRVSGLADVTAVSAGNGYSLALKRDGTVWAWGGNGYGNLGDGTFQQRSTPGLVIGLHDIKAISAGGFHALALMANGTVWGWGDNLSSQASGDGTPTTRRIAVQIPDLTRVVAISAGRGGEGHSLAIREGVQSGDGEIITSVNWAYPEEVVGTVARACRGQLESSVSIT